MAATSNPKAQGQVPRPSASVVIVNSRNEVLLVHRNPQARHFGGVHVFPGGNLDRNQDTSIAMTAIRETFEESGLLLASSSKSSTVLSDEFLDDSRAKIHSQKLNFQSFLSDHGLTPDIASLLPFTQWITPVNVPRRFHTQFYVTFLSASAGFSSGAKQDRIPKPNGGQEVVSARFLHPEDALAEFRAGKITFMPPQVYILQTLSEIFKSRQNMPAERERVQKLSSGPFGRMVINPRPLSAPDKDGRSILTYEGDETRGGSKGRLHRAQIKSGKGGISEMTLQRNFDVLTEIELHAFDTPCKFKL
ncbi:hypothetical protein DXG03_000856 [Asterophora parasitica]|uniref:Nudix hydrolase domain-containing protein n=1 Tax=Asterophora parasitica TaxID=117018 RepID=A0A9P7GC28_9AGAR|nr:hypothetical protein DXG03_000856 [Asterophora parasitica]